jgi:LPS export ABC transporter permease LptG
MCILDKYILKKVIKSYIFILITFIGLHVIVDLFSNLGDFLSSKTPLIIVLQYYLYFLPLIFLRASIFALPIAILFSLGELNKNNEIMTMRASGLSIIRLSLPILFFALALSIFSFFIQEKVIIHSQQKKNNIELEFVEQKEKSEIEENFVFRNQNQLFFVSKFIPQKKTLKDVIILSEDNQGNITEKTLCQKIIYTHNQWIALDVISYQLDKEGRITKKPVVLPQLKIDLASNPNHLKFKKRSFSEYTPIQQLRAKIKNLNQKTSSSFFNGLLINYHKKIAEPLSHFFLAIGILPIALQIKKRKVGLSALGGGFIFGFAYYLIFSVTIALGKAGALIVPLNCWIAPLFFAIVGLSGLLLIK